MLEKEIEKQIVEYVNTQGGLCLKLRVDGGNGFPDRTVIMKGFPAFSLEFKTPKGKPSDKQLHFHKLLWDRGYSSFIVDNCEDAKAIVDARGELYRLNLSIYKRTSLKYLPGDKEG